MKEKTNSRKLDKDTIRILHGGSWNSSAKGTYVSRRVRDLAYRRDDLGFRLVLQTKEKK